MFFRTFFLCVFAALCVHTASATEAITNFDVAIDVAVSGDFTITETITVNAEGRTIRRGIFRDLPRYMMVDGYKTPQNYDVLSVTRDGKPEPYSREFDGNAVRLMIGDADVYLEAGLHTYEITYGVKDQIRRGDTFDEVYWNVTGNYWRYDILKSGASITLPEGASLQEARAFTGALGEVGSDAVFSQSGQTYRFDASRSFAPNEGLTVSIKIDKGVIADTPPATRRFMWWVRNGAILLLSGSLFVILGFYYISWHRVGRDPLKDPVFARYAPPKNYSAAAVSFIEHRGISGHKALTATLLSLAIKGSLTLDTETKKTTIAQKDRAAPRAAEEDALFNGLFPSAHAADIILTRQPHDRFYKVYTKFKSVLTKRFGRPYFKYNGGFMVIGILLSFLAGAAAISQFYGKPHPFVLLGLAGLFLLNILFLFLLPAPTQKGQKIKAEIEGFKLYLKTAEKQRLDAVNPLSDAPPPMTVAHYEAMLPYAVALGVEAPWSKYFEKVMPIEAKNYSPVWGGVHGGNFSNVSKMTDSMISNLSSGVSSAAPQSSGTSGGGGFSGGGGGGGGGGGW